jgi:hypothetical protein
MHKPAKTHRFMIVSFGIKCRKIIHLLLQKRNRGEKHPGAFLLAQKPGYPLQVLESADALSAGFPLLSLAQSA